MTIYHVKPGDWLSKIANQHGKTLEELLEANPDLRPNPDLIVPGQPLTIPQASSTGMGPYARQPITPAWEQPAADNRESPVFGPRQMPTKAHEDDKTSICAKNEPNCESPLFEIVHVTGEGAGGFYVLDEEQTDALRAEIEANEELMEEYGDLCRATPKDSASDAERLAHLESKKKWLIKAAGRQLIPVKEPETKRRKSTYQQKKDLDDELASLQEFRIQVERYQPLNIFRDGSGLEVNWIKLRKKLLEQLDQSISVKEKLLASFTSGQPKEVSSYSNNAMPDFKVRTTSISGGQASKTITKNRVVELIVFSQPDRWRYVSAAFIEQKQVKAKWRKVTNSSKIKQIIGGSKTGAMQAVATELLNQIREDVKKSKESFKAELKVWERKTSEDHALNTLHKELFNVSTSKDRNPNDAVFAVGADAQLMRFAAVASASVTNFDPRKGPIELGGKAEANFALAEGRIQAAVSLPSEAGFACAITYRDGNGELVRHSFGAFRMRGEATLSCFVGGKAGVSACAIVGDVDQSSCYDAKGEDEALASASALLAPALELGVNPKGGIGFKGEAFAGGQAGGQLSGSLQWKAPVRPKQEKAPDWASLLELKTEGNVALGIGAGLDFGLKFYDGELRFYAHGRLVFGPGAAGGFGGVVDAEKILELVVLVCDVLGEVDYRYLLNVDEEVFESFYLGILKAYTEPGETLNRVFKGTLEDIRGWGTDRELLKEHAQELAGNINANSYTLKLRQLPPETVGMMLHTLSETFVEVKEEAQETAIIKLLENVQSWRHFIKALEHMSISGQKTNPLDSLDRLNAILDGNQQQQFNAWIAKLKDEGLPQATLPYSPVPVYQKLGLVEKQMLACRMDGQTNSTSVV